MDWLARNMAHRERKPIRAPLWFLGLIRAPLWFLGLLLAIGWTPAFGQTPERHSAEMDQLTKMEGVGGRRDVYRICDGVYRGGRLTPELATQLKCMGVKTVISLRIVSGDERVARCAGLNYCHIPFKAWRPCDEQVVQFLKIATDKDCQPVYFYCNRGVERTGMMCAVYRMAVCGWSREEAICEMTQGEFDYHSIWKKVLQYAQAVDIDCIKRQAGL
jgi:protein tyrosine phosphatase (PTP) superfamily phosphohydrolase (DUF442 family)